MDCGLEGLTFKAPSLTKSEFAVECDIRNIVGRFLRTGQLPQMREPISVDATRLPDDFQALQNDIAATRQRFEMLPEDERLQYGNDPEAWLAAQAEKAAEEAGKEAKSEAGKEAKSESVTHEQANGESSEEDSKGSSAPAS